MTEKQYNLRAGYYHNYTGICSDIDENLTINEVVDLLNEQDKRIKELKNELELADRQNTELEKENFDLKNSIICFDEKIRDREKAWGELFKDYIDVLKQKDGLEKENEQLKSFIKKIMGIDIIDKW